MTCLVESLKTEVFENVPVFIPFIDEIYTQCMLSGYNINITCNRAYCIPWEWIIMSVAGYSFSVYHLHGDLLLIFFQHPLLCILLKPCLR